MSDQPVLYGQSAAISFGPFELLPDRGLLFRDQQQVKLGSRALALLAILVQHAGETVAPEKLIAHVWPNTFVHEANLKVTMSQLRRVLGDTGPVPAYIMTVSGRGYRFIGQLTERKATERLKPPVTGQPPQSPDTWLIVGRTHPIRDAIASPKGGPMMSLVVSAGEDQMLHAIAAANRLLDSFPDGICFIDLSLTQTYLAAPLPACLPAAPVSGT